ncbi:MAG: hypothetical protein IK118_03800 [Clostridia bacterium]|nr:hypothetical protein [Clostridia bacterium]
MKTYGTYFQNDPERPLCCGEVNLIDPPRRRLRGEPEKRGIEAVPVFCGFCGTDFELMHMGKRGELGAKFPAGEKRLINGHEGVVWVPSENRFAIVLIRGGDSADPTRYTEDETYFEYGCDGADGIFCDRGYFNPDMLLHLPEQYEGLRKLPLSLAKKLVFSDPYACAVFQHERMCDIGAAQNFRVIMAKKKCSAAEAMEAAYDATFERTVIFGLGTTGLFIGDQIRRNHPDARILFVARSAPDSKKACFAVGELGCEYLCSNGLSEPQTAEAIVRALGGRASMFVGTSGTGVEHRVAFKEKVLGCNGVYNSFSLGPQITFDTMPFGFENHVIMASINFTQAHMEKAIRILCESRFDRLTELIDKDEFTADPIGAYENKIYAPGAPLKTAVVWNEAYIDRTV